MKAITFRKLLHCSVRPGHYRTMLHGVLPTVEHGPAFRDMTFSTVIDIGSNRGQFAAFARRRWPDCRLICFEPQPTPRRALHRVLTATDTVHACALGNRNGAARMHLGIRDDSSSLYPFGPGQRRIFAVEEAGTIEVSVRRLDEVFPEALPEGCLIKIDVQGFEREVLLGAGARLSEAKAVYVEVSFRELYEGQALRDEIDALVRRAGFQLRGTFNVYASDGQTVQADLLYVRDPGVQGVVAA